MLLSLVEQFRKSIIFLGEIVNEPSEFEQDEVEQLAQPSLAVLNRLTYEVTEIALDLPGINLEF